MALYKYAYYYYYCYYYYYYYYINFLNRKSRKVIEWFDKKLKEIRKHHRRVVFLHRKKTFHEILPLPSNLFCPVCRQNRQRF